MAIFDEKRAGTHVVAVPVPISSDQTLSDHEKRYPSAEHPQSGLLKAKFATIDLLGILIPTALICKTVLCIVAARIDKDTHSQSIEDAHSITIYLIRFNKQLTTLFTIIFGTILSLLVTRIALWRAQNGASVAELEQWQASRALTDTLKAIWSLRMFTATSAILVAIWSWLYLGSQASTREYTLQISGHKIHIPVAMFNTQGPTAFDAVYYQNWTDSEKALQNAQFAVALDGPKLGTGYDSSGLMLIPAIDQVKPGADHDGYYTIKSLQSADYVSYTGVQVWAKFPDQDHIWNDRLIGKLSMGTSYLNVTCDTAQSRNTSEFPINVLDSMPLSINSTSTISNATTDRFGHNVAFDIWYRAQDSSTPIQAMSTTCRVTVVSLDIQAKCNDRGCFAQKMRPLTMLNVTDYWPVLADQDLAQRFFNELVLSTGVPSDRADTTRLERELIRGYSYVDKLLPDDDPKRFLYDIDILTNLLPQNIGSEAVAHNMSVPDMQDHYQKALRELAAKKSRFNVGPVINTFLTIYQQAQAIKTLNVNKNDTPVIPMFEGKVPSEFLTIAQFYGNYYEPSYVLSIPWIIVDFLACTILLLAAIAAIYLRTKIYVPEVFGFVSSMTIDNPHVVQPEGISSMSGMERARHLKKTRVQFTQFDESRRESTGQQMEQQQQQHHHGHLALVQLDYPGLGPVRKLSRADGKV